VESVMVFFGICVVFFGKKMMKKRRSLHHDRKTQLRFLISQMKFDLNQDQTNRPP
jgi:hypothetical protein